MKITNEKEFKKRLITIIDAWLVDCGVGGLFYKFEEPTILAEKIMEFLKRVK